MTLEILFQDNDIVVCIKPCGILSQSDAKNTKNMITMLEKLCSSPIFPLHRLDREVGGVMVYAKNKYSAAEISKAIVNNSFNKEYIALVHGVPQNLCGEMHDLLFKDSSKNKSYVVKRERKGVKKADLAFTTLKTLNIDGEEYSIQAIKLFTGRTHQIRVQFSSRQMPLIGDKKYGARDNFKEIGLWSHKISFNHPKTNELIEFSSKPQNIIKEYI